MRLIRKICATILVVVLVVGVIAPNDAYAEEKGGPDVSFPRYCYYLKKGELGEDVSYEDWKMLVETSYALEEMLSNSDEFHEVYSSENAPEETRFTPKRGDVIITNGTSSSGILGHAGIITSSSYVLHIAGPGFHPERIPLTTWHNSYTNSGSNTWSKIYRHSDISIAYSAASWAENTYVWSGADYQITANLASTSVTYCSKIVWQAYYYGPSSPEANGPTVGYRMPYDLPTTIHNLSYMHTY